MLDLGLQVKKLKSQLDQKTQRNGTENPAAEILENGSDASVVEVQSEYLRHRVAAAQPFPLDESPTLGLNLGRRFKQANRRPEVQAGQGGAGDHGAGAKRAFRKSPIDRSIHQKIAS